MVSMASKNPVSAYSTISGSNPARGGVVRSSWPRPPQLRSHSVSPSVSSAMSGKIPVGINWSGEDGSKRVCEPSSESPSTSNRALFLSLSPSPSSSSSLPPPPSPSSSSSLPPPPSSSPTTEWPVMYTVKDTPLS